MWMQDSVWSTNNNTTTYFLNPSTCCYQLTYNTILLPVYFILIIIISANNGVLTSHLVQIWRQDRESKHTCPTNDTMLQVIRRVSIISSLEFAFTLVLVLLHDVNLSEVWCIIVMIRLSLVNTDDVSPPRGVGGSNSNLMLFLTTFFWCFKPYEWHTL